MEMCCCAISRFVELKTMHEAAGSNERVVRARGVAEAVARRSYGKLVALLASQTRDVSAAEDALAEAFLSALADWPRNGCPSNPEAWLLTAARRKHIDSVRRTRREEPVTEQLLSLAVSLIGGQSDREIPDHRLAMMFACTHPAIEPGIRTPLILQAVLGLNATAIASAFLMSPATMGQRLVRAKNKIRHAGIAFSVPDRDELPGRLAAVLDAIYAAFAEGWADPRGSDIARRDLGEEAICLGSLVAELLPREPEALGLLSLMLHAEARREARRNAAGEFVPLAEQNTDLWDTQLIEAAEAILIRASALGSVGRYQLEAALQSAHVARRRTGTADWPAVLQLYDALLALSSSPVVAINRALAIAEVHGVEAALEAMPDAAVEMRLADYQPYWAARADLLTKLGAISEAWNAYEMAIGLERDEAVRRFLRRRQAGLGMHGSADK